MLAAIEIVVVVWLLYAAWAGLRSLVRGESGTIHYVAPVHFIFCGFPLLLDLVVGRPEYRRFPGFYYAADSYPTRILYCIYVALCPLIWLWYASIQRSRQEGQPQGSGSEASDHSSWKILSAVAFTLPIWLVLLSPNPEMYLSYTPHGRMLRQQAPEVLFMHMIISKMCLFSIVAGAALLSTSTRLTAALAAIVPGFAIICWIHGKRNAVAFSLALGVYSLWQRGGIPKARLVFFGLVGVGLFMLFSVHYQRQLRFTDEFVAKQDAAFWYDHFRIDYGRDDVIRLAISRELDPDEGRILEWRGESLAALLTMFIPRYIWPDKPRSYSQCVTLQAMHRLPEGGGGVTTSVLGESVANFSWAGFLIGPLILVAVCAFGDRCILPSTRALTLLIVICLQVVHVAPWAMALVLWSGLVFWEGWFFCRTNSARSREMITADGGCKRSATPVPVAGYAGEDA